MQTLRNRFVNSVRRFNEDERGAVIAFILLMFLMMIVAAGGAIDFMRHENVRTRLQNGLDRGVLAAAAFNQTIGEREVVAGYLKTAGFPELVTLVVPAPEVTLNSRRVTASAQLTIRTFFLRIIGINTLTVAATGSAQQNRQHVEISLALDISGSMARELTGTPPTSGPDNRERRLAVVRETAQEFVSLILNEETEDNTSINLIPYAGQVNPGMTAFNYLRRTHLSWQWRTHDYSHCVDFTSGQMDDDDIPSQSTLYQTPHFQWFRFEGSYGHEADWGWCPWDAHRIRYFSNDATALNAAIAGFRGHDGTGANIAMKWALSLLNPDNTTFLTTLRNAGEFTFTDRPAEFSDQDALKIIVLMTDGNTRYQRRPNNSAYDSIFDVTNRANNNLSSNISYEMTTQTTARQQLRDLCALAKSQRVVVFTVGFDINVGSEAHTDLSYCASSASHFFDVDGLELRTAFTLIAATIQNLRLVE